MCSLRHLYTSFCTEFLGSKHTGNKINHNSLAGVCRCDLEEQQQNEIVFAALETRNYIIKQQKVIIPCFILQCGCKKKNGKMNASWKHSPLDNDTSVMQILLSSCRKAFSTLHDRYEIRPQAVDSLSSLQASLGFQK